MNKCMETFKKIIVIILEIVLFITFCGVVFYFLFPEIFGKEKKSEEIAENPTEKVTYVSTEARTTEVSDSDTEVSDATTEVNVSTELTDGKLVSDKGDNENKATGGDSSRSKDKKKHKDESPPFFMFFNAYPTLRIGSAFNIHDYVGYADDVDRNVDIKVNGDMDMSAEGVYPVTVVLTDDVGHTNSMDMNINVVKDFPVSDSDSTTPSKGEAFSDFIKGYKNDNTEVGIDVSRWQETVDFNKVKAAGCEFVYMRLGGCDKGEYFTDRYYKQNIQNAKKAGLKVGVYWYAEDRSPEETAKSVEYLMSVLDGEELDFPIAYDWEDFANFENYGMNLYDINDCFEAFADGVESYGYSACLYSSKNFLNHTWTNEEEHPVWLAHYISSTDYTGKYFMWQHSCEGRIDGVNGPVDLDILYK